MKFYLIDDDKNVLHILKRIIRDRGLGEIAGTAENGVDALTDLPLINPDIVIVDLLMPEIDGITFVKRARSYAPDLTFIMLSQVASKDMIADAYSAGIEFYIHKPINSIEVESILRKVSESLTARRTLQQVQTIFQTQQNFVQPQGFINDTVEKPYIIRLKGILQKLGITGERGSKDIISLVDYLIQHNQKVDNSLYANFAAGSATIQNPWNKGSVGQPTWEWSTLPILVLKITPMTRLQPTPTPCITLNKSEGKWISSVEKVYGTAMLKLKIS